ncbi:hypothetical protein [Mesoplasma photuris]|uniref:hypothetical protein n=1 Tax=Mesoplasma photuris TaxID=217731 RepID=UPI00056C53EF|nr:hypothetical protein [Mesoplasma photuris]
MGTNIKKGVFTAIFSVLISITSTLIQFLLIYWILANFGTEFNGFVKITIAIAVIGGSIEGALGVSTVLLMMKPIAAHDWIEANAVYSASKKKYHKNMFRGIFLMSLVAFLYPLFLQIFPYVIDKNLSGIPNISEWGINYTDNTNLENPVVKLITYWELVALVLIISSKDIFTAGFFGVYENVLQADQKNGVRKSVILLTDVIIYVSLFILLNFNKALNPIIPFLVILAYPFVRGLFIRIYVKKYYPWIKFYGDLDSFKLRESTKRLGFTGIGETIMLNADLIILMIILGTSGLEITSMLSIYMIIGVNIRILMISLITSFREYFLAIMIRDGRMTWDAFSKYELYTYIVAAFGFIFMTTLGPYLVVGLFGKVVTDGLNAEVSHTIMNFKDLYNANILDIDQLSVIQKNVGQLGPEFRGLADQINAFKFVFGGKWFSMMFAGTMVVTILFQSQLVLIQTKGMNYKISKSINTIAISYLVVVMTTALCINLLSKDDNVNKIQNVLIAFYMIKIAFILISYFYLWTHTWRKVVYNSKLKNLFSNFLSLVVPIALSIIVTEFSLFSIYPIEVTIPELPNFVGNGGDEVISLSPVSISSLLLIMLTTGILGFISILIVPAIFRPKVALSIILNMPGIKSIIKKKTSKAKIERYTEEEFNIESIQNQKDIIFRALKGADSKSKHIDENKFNDKYKFKEKPKSYIIKGGKNE